MLTISKLKRWSINYYIDTAQAAEHAAGDLARAGGGLGEYYSERETRTPVWLLAGDAHKVAPLVGLTDVERAGGDADAELVARWLDDGVTPNGAHGRAFSERGVHGFDLTFCAPKSVSLVRALRTDDVVAKAIADAHTTALSDAMEYLTAHAGYTRVHNPRTGEKDLVRLPGLVAIAYQHETSRCGDPHLHTHVIVPNRQARTDGQIVSIDGTSLYHEARAAGVIYQATLRRELHQSMGFEWAPVDPSTGMAELAGVDRDTITAWSRRSTQLREWAANNLTVVDGPLSAAQLAAAQKATRPAKPEELAWATLVEQWRADARGLHLDRAGFRRRVRRGARPRAARSTARAWPMRRRRLRRRRSPAPTSSRSSAPSCPLILSSHPAQVLEAAVDEIGMRLTAPRAAHQREGHEHFTLDRILAEEKAVLDLVDARDDRSMLWINDEDTAGLSADQKKAVQNIAASPWLVQPLSAPAGAGKTTSMRALAATARRSNRRLIVLAPTGKAVDVAVREGAGDDGYTITGALQSLRKETLQLNRQTLVMVDEAGMVGTDDLRQLLTATTAAGAKTVLVGDAHQLAPVKARGGMFAQLCTDLPWTQHLSEVWRMRDPAERSASLALRDGGPAPVRRAIKWYRTHDRLHSGDPIAMAHDALTAYKADTAAGKDALLVCDTTEMTDALNRRLHDTAVGPQAATVTGARGHRIGVGDLIISRRNDPTVELATPPTTPARLIRCVTATAGASPASTPRRNRLAAERLDDGARVVFEGDYLREHITHGYAVTVHSAQGVTADTTHAVLGENTARSMLYVAMTRGRQANSAYLYGRISEGECGPLKPEGLHVMERGNSDHVGQLLRALIANDDRRQATAHDVAAQTPSAALPERVHRLAGRRAAAVNHRRTTSENWVAEAQSFAKTMGRARDHYLDPSRDHGFDRGMDL